MISYLTSVSAQRRRQTDTSIFSVLARHIDAARSSVSGYGLPNTLISSWLFSFIDASWSGASAPRYLSDYIQRVADSNCCRLRSSSSSQLVIRRTQLSTVGDAFPVTGSRLWKSPTRRHLRFNANCFSETPENLPLFPIISFLAVFGSISVHRL